MGFTFKDNRPAGTGTRPAPAPADAISTYNDLVARMMSADASLAGRGHAAVRIKEEHPGIYASYVSATGLLK